MLRALKRTWIAVAGLAAVAACSDASPTHVGDGAGTPPAPEIQMQIVSGGEQTAGPGQMLADPLVVQVTSKSGRPVKNQIVNFHVVSGGGKVFAGTALTGGDGIAKERWTLGTDPAKEQVVEARAVDAESGEPIVFATFHARIEGGATPEPAAASVVVSPATATVEVDGSVQLAAAVSAADGGEVSADAQVVWTSLNGGIAAVDASGLVTAKAAGTARIVANAGGAADTAQVTVKEPANTTSGGSTGGTTTAPSGTKVPLQVVRLDGGSGTALVSSGVPLAPGMLRPGDVGKVRLFVGGQEQSVYVEALSGRHNDGSVRSLLVQFQASVGSSPLNGELVLGSARGTTDRAKQAVSFSMNRAVPQAALLPTDPAYLISTRLVGPTIAASANSFSPGYEQKFATIGDRHWQVFESEYTTQSTDLLIYRNYYDRALAYVANWVRTGDAESYRRALMYAVAWRDRYGAPNGYNIQPHQVMIEGIALHYLLTGDAVSRQGVAQNAAQFRDVWLPYLSNKTATYTEDRPKARTIEAFLMARQVGVPGDWEGLLRQTLGAFLAHQSADGAYRYPVGCNTSSNFQSGLFNDALVRYAEEFENDPRILPAVRRWVDWLWSSEWLPADGAFKYHEADCQAPGGFNGTGPAPDLNLLIVNAFGWVYRQTGDATYRQRGDTVFTEGLSRVYWGSNGSQADKQFNQQYRSGFRYLRYRR